ncbi:uncharacterized protein LOC132872175 isoform X2 [Neoarius graeffei]|uniref:uncharacterized protein LOC132872175 isoform X2 n=1 Tax=Neoarius graeffei TaxID=443677 RepID=UPI00298C264A|nr:uncharacterized protein LOC132872175 isoform X2 [Neoarius graeffei]
MLGYYLLLIVLHVTQGCSLRNNKNVSNIIAHVGNKALLPCSCCDLQCKPEKRKWRKHNGQAWNSVPPNQNRFHLSNQSPGNFSLLIADLTLKDEGLYRCEIGQDEYTDIKLMVRGKNIMEPSILAFIPVVLVLLGLMGVIFWRYRAKKQKQTLSSKGATGQMNKSNEKALRKEQETQDKSFQVGFFRS